MAAAGTPLAAISTQVPSTGTGSSTENRPSKSQNFPSSPARRRRSSQPRYSAVSDRPVTGAPARTRPDVLFPTVNGRRKRPRSPVTNVRRAGSRPYFEWESELRRRPRARRPPTSPGGGGPRASGACCLWLLLIADGVAIDLDVVRRALPTMPSELYTLYDPVARHASAEWHRVICVVGSRNSIFRRRTAVGR